MNLADGGTEAARVSIGESWRQQVKKKDGGME
jgi:hypothetical protein